MNSMHQDDTFLNRYFSDIEKELAQSLEPPEKDENASVKIRHLKSIVKKFSVLGLFVVNGNGKKRYLFSKARKNSGESDFHTAIQNENQRAIAKNEYEKLCETHQKFAEKTHLKVSTPIAFIDELNTMIFARAEGKDLSRYINSYALKPALDAETRANFLRIAELIAAWITHYHHVFELEPEELDKAAFLDGIILSAERMEKFKNEIPVEKLNDIKRQLDHCFKQKKVCLYRARLHGDYKPKHIWHEDAKALTVIDFGNEIESQSIYEDLAGFIVEIQLLDFGFSFHKINRLPEFIEQAFIANYGGRIDKNVLTVFIIKYLIKKWSRRKRRLCRFSERHFRIKKVPIVSTFGECYTDLYFQRKIRQRLSQLNEKASTT